MAISDGQRRRALAALRRGDSKTLLSMRLKHGYVLPNSSLTVDAIPAGARIRDESLIYGFAMLFASDEWLGDSGDPYALHDRAYDDFRAHEDGQLNHYSLTQLRAVLYLTHRALHWVWDTGQTLDQAFLRALLAAIRRKVSAEAFD